MTVNFNYRASAGMAYRPAQVQVSARNIPSQMALRPMFGSAPAESLAWNVDDNDRKMMKSVIADLNGSADNVKVGYGRSHDNDYITEDVYVSRRHVEFYKKDKAFYIRDLGTPEFPGAPFPGSLNGTWHISGQDLIPNPIDIRGPVKPLEGDDELMASRLDGGRVYSGEARMESSPQKIQNGDFIYISGRVFPIEGLESKDPDVSIMSQFKSRVVQQREFRNACSEILMIQAKLKRLVQVEHNRQSDVMKQGWTREKSINADDLLQVRLLLNNNIRFTIYSKLREMKVPHAACMQLLDKLRELSMEVMKYQNGRADINDDLRKQSIVDLKDLKGLDSDSDFGSHYDSNQ